ncbi:hypothetical protein IU412_14290 [Nocardia cyriacigeorgica]|nr:hypothetical protein [Nocardia cyriacigeorgica]
MSQTGARERLTIDDLLGQAELTADRTHLVLEQQPQRFDELEFQIVGQAADIVVGLDVGRASAAAGFHHVRVERALYKELDLGRGALAVGLLAAMGEKWVPPGCSRHAGRRGGLVRPHVVIRDAPGRQPTGRGPSQPPVR